jgi:hypothetical protein
MAETEIQRPSQAYRDSLQALLAQATDETVPTGILHTRIASLFSIANFNGTRATPLTQPEWEQQYFDLHASVLPGSRRAGDLPPLAELSRRARGHAAADLVPIAILNLEHHYPGTRLVAAIRAAAREDRAIVLAEDPREMIAQRRAFAATALLPDRFDNFTLLPHRHTGLAVNFVVDPALYFNNTGEPLGPLEIDFGDGAGTRPVAPGQPVPVTYAAPGRKTVVVTQPGSPAKVAAFRFDVVARTAPLPDTTFRVDATIPYNGQTTFGFAYVWYGSSNGQKHDALVRPLVISEGFPGGATSDKLYDRLNGEGTMVAMLAMGIDVVALAYGNPGEDGGTLDLHLLAFVYVRCIQMVIARRRGTGKLVAGGASMGGIVARWALCYMQRENLAHECRLFFTFDSPHRGATVPLGVQWMLKALAEMNPDAAKQAAKLSSDAAQMMLHYYVPTYDWNGPVTSAKAQAFSRELVMYGYPKGVTKIAISNGAGDGQHAIPDGADVIRWSGNACAYGHLWSEATSADRIVVSRIYLEPVSFFFVIIGRVTNCVNWEGAPGGQAQANGELAEALIKSDYGWVEHWYDNCCFIPTVSALDAYVPSLYTPIPATGLKTPFDDYIVLNRNVDHVTITPEIKAFLLKWLARSA